MSRTKIPCPVEGYSMAEAGTASPMDAEIQQLFLPFRGFCARKGVQAKEVVLEDTDISKALVDYINANYINNIVVGASNRNAITRKFRNPDVPSGLAKSTPDFCALYVIAKGKVMAARSANRPPPVQRQLPTPGLPPNVDPDDAVRTPFARAGMRSPAPAYLAERRSFERAPDYMRTPGREVRPLSTAKTVPPSMLTDYVDGSIRPPRLSNSRESFSEGLDFLGKQGFQSTDLGAEGVEFSTISTDSPRASFTSASRDLEAEMRRLKLELKQTMDMYSTACKEALSAKQKAQELHQWKMVEARKFEEARLSEEAAIAMAELEKAKCKAAIEAAEAAQRIAEIEAMKRKNAEIKATLEAAEKKKALDALANTDVRYRKYTIEEIEVATDFFSEALKIGEGGYGPVYRASLDHTPVAIKVLRPDAAQGRKQFQQEVEVLSCIRHPNMVLLLGACPEYGCLVYEYMDSGSLEDRLFRRGNTPPIPWHIRFKIAAEIATGLLFLHQAKPEPLVHRDLKPGNILVDRNYTSKISDVGLARLVPPSVADNVTQYRMTSTAGTFCYIDPEYQQTGMLGIKSDIYSLGIMLLQIVTAKPPMGLTHHVERAIDKGTFADMLDQSVSDWPVQEALGYAKMALKCAELRRKDRPDLATVILPELNRLRKLGGKNSYEDSSSNMNASYTSSGNNYGNSGAPPQRSQPNFGQRINTGSNGLPHTPLRSRSPLGGQEMMTTSPKAMVGSPKEMANSPRGMTSSPKEAPPQWRSTTEEGAMRFPRAMPRRMVPYDVTKE
ncbi:U-box domain-containing protein 35-like isoform X2 [Tasmannia lanceolata]|uniref:U-box domain-containing protein 35-like isoform X2 n=1 Tax=Tasmannia lanceolata TaxID=3420 RepID=UPI004063F90E